jgi:hypothetical protein
MESATIAGVREPGFGEVHSLYGAFATVGALARQEVRMLGKREDSAAIQRVHRLVRDRWEGLDDEANRDIEALLP